MLKELQEKCENLDQTKADRSDLGKLIDDLNKIRDQLSEMEKEMNYLKQTVASGSGAKDGADGIQDLITKIERFETRLDGIEKRLGQMARANASNNVNMNEPMSGDLENRLNSLEDRFNNHENQNEEFKKETINMLAELQDQLNNKVDYDKLKELEDKLLGILEDRIRQLIKQLADKNETKKNLKMLEKQLKNLLDVFMQKQNSPDEENAMFSKKPLGGFSCASCEKNLINLQNKPPEYFNWNRFPTRDPQERIAKLGQGFSRMLSSMKPENYQKFQGGSVKQNQQHFYDDGHVDQSAPRTMQNFYHPQEDQRPASAQVLPGIKEQK